MSHSPPLAAPQDISPQQRLQPIGLVALAALAMMLPAIWNGFPLVYSDTGAYLATAFEGKVPMARPTGYGLFIRYTSLGGHLWWPLLAQSLLFAGLLLRSLRVALPNLPAWKSFLPASVSAVGLTGTAWFASQIMPDIFTGMVALVFFLILFDQQARWWGRLLYAALAYVFCFAHYSHMALLLALAGLALAVWLWQAVRKRAKAFPLARLAWAIVPALLTIFSYCYVNAMNGHGWRMTRSAHVFTVARLSETGLLAEYLHETCGYRPCALCPYADSLPTSAAAFIWDEGSPFKMTGYWENSQLGYDSLLTDFFKRGHYMKAYLAVSVKSGLAQLLELSVGEGLTPYNESSSPYKFFERAMPSQLPAYRSSRQFEQVFDFHWEQWVLVATMLLSMVVLGLGLVGRGRRLPLAVWGLVLVAMASYVTNAFLTGALANVYARLQARVAWLVVLACVVVILAIWDLRKADAGK